MPRLRLAAPLLAVALAAAACGGSGDEDVAAQPVAETTTTTADTSSSTDAGAPAPEVPEQLDFVAPDVRGGQVIGADFAGQDLVIWFWAPW